jgi:hypothetical protein
MVTVPDELGTEPDKLLHQRLKRKPKEKGVNIEGESSKTIKKKQREDASTEIVGKKRKRKTYVIKRRSRGATSYEDRFRGWFYPSPLRGRGSGACNGTWMLCILWRRRSFIPIRMSIRNN